MRVVVKLFAVLRERAGLGELPLEVREGETVAGVIGLVGERFPELRPMLGRSAVAVNLGRAEMGVVLREGDEVAVLPPVSGG